MRYTQILEFFFMEISFPFDFHPEISGIFSEIQQFPDFLELFPGNFRTNCHRFENFEIFGRMESAHCVCCRRTCGNFIFLDTLRYKNIRIGVCEITLLGIKHICQ